MSEENTTQSNKTSSRKFVLVCWFMVLVTLVILTHFICMLFNRSCPLTEILGILGLTVTVIITYVTGNVYQKTHTSFNNMTNISNEEKAPI